MNEHEHGENDEVQAGQGFGQALVVACQPPEAVEPAEAALDYPTAGQQGSYGCRHAGESAGGAHHAGQ